MNSVAWLVLTGDALHNFVDGMSIGAAFTENIYTGISVSLAVLCEELPHELGKMFSLILSVLLVVLGFYGPSTLFRSFRARSVNLSTLFLGKPPGQFTST